WPSFSLGCSKKRSIHCQPSALARSPSVWILKAANNPVGPAFPGAALLPGILIDFLPCRGKSLQRRCQRDPAVSQTPYPFETVFIAARGNTKGYPRFLRRMRQNAVIYKFKVTPVVTDGCPAPKPPHDFDGLAQASRFLLRRDATSRKLALNIVSDWPHADAK